MIYRLEIIYTLDEQLGTQGYEDDSTSRRLGGRQSEGEPGWATGDVGGGQERKVHWHVRAKSVQHEAVRECEGALKERT